MNITLTCINHQDGPASGSEEIQLDRQGGTIGRAPDNDFVVADPERFASNHHCRIFYDSRGYCIEDTSSNGTLINNEKELFRGQSHVLHSGDILTIGNSVIEIAIQPEISHQEQSEPPSRPRAEPQQPAALSNSKAEANQSKPVTLQTDPIAHPSARQVSISIDEAFSFSKRKETEPNQVPEPGKDRPATVSTDRTDADRPLSAKQERAVPASKEREVPAGQETAKPAVQQRGVPATLGRGAAKQPKAAPARQEKEPPASRPGNGHEADQIRLAFLAFLSELDIEPQQLASVDKIEFMHLAGSILCILTDGMMEILKARNDVKKSFRMDTTKIKGARNNALKFSGTPEEAIYRMLTKQQGFLAPVESVEEAVQDAKAHQVAMVSGMNAAIHSVLASFDPKKLEATLDQGFSISKKSKYWDRYNEKYRQIAQDLERNFNDLFSEAFSQSYEEQVRKVEDE